MKKILIIGTAYPYRGGLAAYIERLATEFMNNGEEVEVKQKEGALKQPQKQQDKHLGEMYETLQVERQQEDSQPQIDSTLEMEIETRKSPDPIKHTYEEQEREVNLLPNQSNETIKEIQVHQQKEELTRMYEALQAECDRSYFEPQIDPPQESEVEIQKSLYPSEQEKENKMKEADVPTYQPKEIAKKTKYSKRMKN